MTRQVRYLTRGDVESLNVGMQQVIHETELAFSEKGHGRGLMPPKHWIAPDEHRFFSAMSGALPRIGAVSCKWQSGSDRNAELGLPYITGLLILNHLDNGLPVAIMDSTWITAMRTAAATGVTARHLAPPDPRVAGIIGCGVQGRSNVEALACVHDGIDTVRAFDIAPRAMDDFADEITRKHRMSVVPCASVEEVMAGADIVVTCGPIVPGGDRSITESWMEPGCLLVTLDYDCYLAAGTLSAVDAVFTDDFGQMEHLKEYGFFPRTPARLADIGAVVAGAHPGRVDDRHRIIAVNMGIALEDVAVASLVYDRADADNVGTMLDL